jgi:hypothetical protein
MASTIHKQILKATDIQTIRLPLHAEILCAREQGDHICIWYWCDPSEVVTKNVTIAVVGTGHAAPEIHEANYIGTAFLYGGSLVFHVFQRLYPEAK